MEISAPCPWCRAQGRDRSGDNLKVNTGKRTYQCFSCGARPKTHGPLDAVYYGGDFTTRTQEVGEPERDPTNWHPTPLISASRSVVVRGYLRRRGVSAQQMQDHGEVIKAYAGRDPLFQGRVFFLFPEFRFWQARALRESKRKYLNAHGDKGGAIFKCLHGRGPLMIVEGIFDALAVERAGFKAVALLGKTASPKQIRHIAEMTERAVVLLDADAPADSRKLLFTLLPHVTAKMVELPRGEDPGDMSTDELRGIIHEATRKK